MNIKFMKIDGSRYSDDREIHGVAAGKPFDTELAEIEIQGDDAAITFELKGVPMPGYRVVFSEEDEVKDGDEQA